MRFQTPEERRNWKPSKLEPGEARQPMRGLGDVVAAVTTAVGIKPCGGCKQRQAALNRLVPFASAEGSPAPTESTSASADGANPSVD
jgi:hypothetical protein